MTLRGTIHNGIVLLEEPSALPEGTAVEVRPTSIPESGPAWDEVLKDFIGSAPELPTDMARNHDHYLHGAPKR
jgi:hypothetical protein